MSPEEAQPESSAGTAQQEAGPAVRATPWPNLGPGLGIILRPVQETA